MTEGGSSLLPQLTQSFVELGRQCPIKTQDFTDACGAVIPIFDHIGSVFVIAKHEFSSKRESLVALAPTMTTLSDVVEAGRKDGSIMIKGSPGRNLHRLMNSILFISHIFQNLEKGMLLREAVSDAYDATLAQIHTWVVRAGIKAGMIALPTRENFLKSLGETEETARQHAHSFVDAARLVVAHIEELYDGVAMPRSDFSISALWS
ncbi:hypothetical protein H632_c923p1 [Helicosporidium sp. ATCC 50920]|nr:hypothetical protein H632_c923p1 [Helicosporidium sp. ATCC 50920]|eukprot:KDD75016.1 hypothetical protein H632_c923p1 [Helicosporidium sp. ATCC 50920]